MPRVRRGSARTKATRRLLKRAKGFVGGRKRYRQATETIIRAEVYATRDRRRRKRDFRSLWITRIGAAVRARGMTYNLFMSGLKKSAVELNRKLLSALAIDDPAAFDAVVAVARESQAK